MRWHSQTYSQSPWSPTTDPARREFSRRLREGLVGWKTARKGTLQLTREAKSHAGTVLGFKGQSQRGSNAQGKSALTTLDDLGSLDLDDEGAAGGSVSSSTSSERLQLRRTLLGR